MLILVDGLSREVEPGTTLADIVAACGHVPSAVATAVDGRFVPRGERATHVLQPGDEVLLFQAITGG